MKLLMIYMTRFGYTPTIKTVESMPEHSGNKIFENVQTAFIHVEEKDIGNEVSVKRKLIKNLKWISGKNNTKKIILHSFAHLAESKADPVFTKSLFDETEERLSNSGFQVEQTPFGYFLDLEVEAPGFSLARVFKDL